MGLSCLNVINVLAYIANLLISYGVGAIGYGGLKTNAEISEIYQTLVTPDAITFGIWAMIFVSQLVFVIVQLFPAYQSSPFVSKAIGYDYVNVCIFQIGWTFAFSFDYILISLICMVILLYFLISIVNDQYKVSDLHPPSVVDYWLLKFPFSLHCGWIIAATFVNISVFLVSLNLDATIQYYVALGSLGALALIACFSVAFPTQGDYIIGLTLAWASLGVFLELGNPKDLIISTFSEDQIIWVRMVAILAIPVMLLAIVLKVLYSFVQRRRRHRHSTESDYHRYDESRSRGTSRPSSTKTSKTKKTRNSKTTEYTPTSPSDASTISEV